MLIQRQLSLKSSKATVKAVKKEVKNVKAVLIQRQLSLKSSKATVKAVSKKKLKMLKLC